MTVKSHRMGVVQHRVIVVINTLLHLLAICMRRHLLQWVLIMFVAGRILACCVVWWTCWASPSRRKAV